MNLIAQIRSVLATKSATAVVTTGTGMKVGEIEIAEGIAETVGIEIGGTPIAATAAEGIGMATGAGTKTETPGGIGTATAVEGGTTTETGTAARIVAATADLAMTPETGIAEHAEAPRRTSAASHCPLSPRSTASTMARSRTSWTSAASWSWRA
jgi:hypothetical protein